MDAWLRTSKYWAVGIYIAGANRYCKEQANLTPDWVTTQLKNGWRLLPLTVGRQARCNTNYKGKPRISADPTNNYEKARAQGRDQAVQHRRRRPKALGHREGQHALVRPRALRHLQGRCRESALYFLSAWTRKLHGEGYVSGVYSERVERHQDARRRAYRASGGRSRCPTRSGSPTGTARSSAHLEVLHQRRLDAPRPGPPVPGRPRREARRGVDQHRQQLPRPRQGLGARQGAAPLQAREARTSPTTRPSRRATAATRCARPSAC